MLIYRYAEGVHDQSKFGNPCTRSMIAHNNIMKIDEINVLAAEYNFDVICLTETWLDTSIDANSIRLIGYRVPFRLDRNRHSGGVFFVS